MDIKLEALDIRMKVLRRYKTAFERQIGESVFINRNLDCGTELLNSKNEYNRCLIPRLTVDEDKKDEFERMREDKIEKEIKSKIAILKSTIRDGTENQPKRKKKKRENLMTVCDELISFNDAK